MKTSKKTFLKKVLVVCLLVAGVIASSLFLGAKSVDEIYEYFKPFFQSLLLIQSDYYDKDKVNDEKLLEEAIKGLLKGLDDPFAWYFSAREAEENRIDTEAEYGGLGIVVEYDQDHEAVRVVSPMVGTPAQRAGLKSGDLIISIDSVPVAEMGYWEAVKRLRGQPGTSVTIQVLREGFEEPLEFTLIREKIELKTVKYDFLDSPEGRVGYIRITNFSVPTADELRDALNRLFQMGIKGIVLDLRDNPGGLLDTAIEVASFFVDEGVIVKVRDSHGFVDVYKSYGNDFPNVPMVLVVNGGSASASEIVTGALMDNHIATVVGSKTYGKAAVQRVYPLSNGGELWLPIAHYFTPSDKDIHLQGIEPEITVEATDVHETFTSELTLSEVEVQWETDPFLKKALEVLEEKIRALERKD
ncbi:MAG: carboxyl-terminal processing protease [Thermotogota bacterium]|nr:carboxyl-terminal processing protease [Thermotogota bacterium]MDK2864740.1 carboxyl-terminal processing protease [Thermotogota bacterium]